MTTAIDKKAVTSATRFLKETNQMRREAARADQLFTEGLARLQSEYKERLRRAAGIMDEETAAETATDHGSDQAAHGDDTPVSA
jgi:hypothetical protein